MIKSAYSVKFCPQGYRVTVVVGIPIGDADRIASRYLCPDLAICGECLTQNWGHTLEQKVWLANEFGLGEGWEKFRFQREELGVFPDANLGRQVAVEVLNHYRRLLDIISEHYVQAVAYECVVELS